MERTITEKKYRPFKSREECMEGILSKEPYGWVMDINNQTMAKIVYLDESTIVIGRYDDSISIYNYEQAFSEFKFADGSPFGGVETNEQP
jgi:hypothetical protein